MSSTEEAVANPREVRPVKGSPEYALWIAAIEIAMAAPWKHDAATTFATKIPWREITRLRAALDDLGVDWRKAKEAQS